MKRAWCMIRNGVNYRRECVLAGLTAIGYKLEDHIDDPRPGDVVVMWNRYAGWHETAGLFERRGADVIVMENGYLGKSWRGGEWFAVARNHHAGAGSWVYGGPERWDALGVELKPWRTGGTETLILEQRGIGEPGVASPMGWAENAAAKYGGRIRKHPGKFKPLVPLDVDLRNVRQVITWHSGAALQALVEGVPVWYDFPKWIGGAAALPLSAWPGEPKMDDTARLEMFRRLAWTNWNLEEIKSGEAFASLFCPF